MADDADFGVHFATRQAIQAGVVSEAAYKVDVVYINAGTVEVVLITTYTTYVLQLRMMYYFESLMLLWMTMTRKFVKSHPAVTHLIQT